MEPSFRANGFNDSRLESVQIKKIIYQNVDYMIFFSYICSDIKLLTLLNNKIMDLQIKVFKSPVKMDKPVFRETVFNFPPFFSYETIVGSMKSIYGNNAIIQFNIIRL